MCLRVRANHSRSLSSSLSSSFFVLFSLCPLSCVSFFSVRLASVWLAHRMRVQYLVALGSGLLSSGSKMWFYTHLRERPNCTITQSRIDTISHSHNRSLAHSLTRSLAHSNNRSLAQSLTRSLAHSLTRTIAQSLNRTIAQQRNCSLAHSRNRSLAHSLTRKDTHSLTLSLAQACITHLHAQLAQSRDRAIALS